MAKRITKRQAASDRAAAWRVALAEGRVVRFNDGAPLTPLPSGIYLTSYPTVARATAARDEAIAAGLTAEIVRVPATA